MPLKETLSKISPVVTFLNQARLKSSNVEGYFCLSIKEPILDLRLGSYLNSWPPGRTNYLPYVISTRSNNKQKFKQFTRYISLGSLQTTTLVTTHKIWQYHIWKSQSGCSLFLFSVLNILNSSRCYMERRSVL